MNHRARGWKVNSIKTTVLGVCSILAAVGGAGMALLDGNAATNVDWPTLIAAITAGVGLIAARDNDKSSEDVGVK
mgnify:CR=1 FL=1